MIDLRPSARAPQRASRPLLGRGVALGGACALLFAADVSCRVSKPPPRPPAAIDEVLVHAGSFGVTLPPPLRAEETVFVRRRADGAVIVAGPDAVALVTGEGGRVLASRPGERPAGVPAVSNGGSVLVPFPGRIEVYDASGTFLESRPRDGPLHALAVQDGRIVAAGLDESGRLLHFADPTGDFLRLDVRREVAMRFRARVDTDARGTIWAIHPACYTVLGFASDGGEIRIDGTRHGYVPPRPYRGPPSPRAIGAWTDRAWIVETVVGAWDGAAVSIRACGHPQVEIHGRGAPLIAATPGLRLVGRDGHHRLLFVPANAEGTHLSLEVYGMRACEARPAVPRRRCPALFVFVSSHDCPACLSILGDVEALSHEHGPHGLHVRAIVDADDRDGFRIVSLEAPGLVALPDRRGEARRRLAVAVGPALRLVSADGEVLLALDGVPPHEAAANLRAAIEAHCACRAEPAP